MVATQEFILAEKEGMSMESGKKSVLFLSFKNNDASVSSKRYIRTNDRVLFSLSRPHKDARFDKREGLLRQTGLKQNRKR